VPRSELCGGGDNGVRRRRARGKGGMVGCVHVRGGAHSAFYRQRPLRPETRREDGGPDGAGKRAFGRQAAQRGPVGCALGHSTRRAQAPRCIGACEASGGAARALLAWGTQLPRQTVGRHAAGVRA
jgi:hypothetical protein